MRIIITFLLLITVYINPLSAQEEEEVNVVGFRFLDYGNNLPEDILKAKSIVLVSVPPVSKTSSDRFLPICLPACLPFIFPSHSLDSPFALAPPLSVSLLRATGAARRVSRGV